MAQPFETTATRLWKRLTPQERLAAAARFFEQPAEETLGGAYAAIVKTRRLRPQVARALPADEKARLLSTVLDPGEDLASALLVALHVGERQPLLSTFLDNLGLPHEDGILKEEGAALAVGEPAARTAVAALATAFPKPQVLTYLNALWLQDRDRWRALENAPEWID